MLDCMVETPAELQMVMVDILETVRNNNDGAIPTHYVIKPTDFADTFPTKFPITSLFKDVKVEYDKKWEMQKFKSNRDFIDNMYDTKEFWIPFKNV